MESNQSWSEEHFSTEIQLHQFFISSLMSSLCVCVCCFEVNENRMVNSMGHFHVELTAKLICVNDSDVLLS